VLAFSLLTLVIARVHPGRPVLIAYLLSTLVLLAVGAVAVTQLVLRADLEEAELRLTTVPAVVATFGMACTLAAALALGAMVVVVAPGLLVTQDVTPRILAAAVMLLALANLLALVGCHRGWLRQLTNDTPSD